MSNTNEHWTCETLDAKRLASSGGNLTVEPNTDLILNAGRYVQLLKPIRDGILFENGGVGEVGTSRLNRFKSGTLTLTRGGAPSAASVQVPYQVCGSFCTLFLPSISGTTTSSTVITPSGIPEALRGPVTTSHPIVVINSATDEFGLAKVEDLGNIVLGRAATGSAFTNTAVCGIHNTTATYRLNL